MRDRKSRNRAAESGVALILSVLVLLLAGTLVLRALARPGASTEPAARSRAGLYALFAADSGVQRALDQIAAEPPLLAPIDFVLEDGTSVQSRRRGDIAPRPISRLGVVCPPDGYEINVGSAFVNRLYRVHVTAEAPVGATAELEADLARLEIGADLDAFEGALPWPPGGFADPDLGEIRARPVRTRLKLRGPPGSGDRCGVADGDGDCRGQPVAIFAAGYDAASDPNHADFAAGPDHRGWSRRSKALYAVSLDTGEILAKVAVDPADIAGPAAMRFALPGAAAVLDLDFDGFADVAYVGDLGGQIWKWDLHAVGDDRNADGRVDNWPAGVFFRAEPADLGGGTGMSATPRPHYRGFYAPPAASFWRGELRLVFGSGDRVRLADPGRSGFDENDRIYVARDSRPGAASGADVAPPRRRVLSEADLSNVSGAGSEPRLDGHGYFMVMADGEKIFTHPTVVSGRVIVASFSPVCSSGVCAEAGGRAFLHAFELGSGRGFFPGGARRTELGPGMPSEAELRMAADPDGDRIRVETSADRIFSRVAPSRRRHAPSIVGWRQRY